MIDSHTHLLLHAWRNFIVDLISFSPSNYRLSPNTAMAQNALYFTLFLAMPFVAMSVLLGPKTIIQANKKHVFIEITFFMFIA